MMMAISYRTGNESFMLSQLSFKQVFSFAHRYTKQNRPKMKKSKDPERKQLLQTFRSSMNDLTIDVQGTKRL
jgi:hypothetical protein